MGLGRVAGKVAQRMLLRPAQSTPEAEILSSRIADVLSATDTTKPVYVDAEVHGAISGPNVIVHGLGRIPNGWTVVDNITSITSFWRDWHSEADPGWDEQTMRLFCDGNGRIRLRFE